ncbi:putative glycosyltransferase [Parafrankia sp. EAN1pec]|uniref:glycosyltransferase family 2 protein n=1 Tax=Parafrankia sp. (strain EAN1pec) TaxID=298653 RepID=UPI0000542CC6|nr:putative glycosyltransferase [Frankia sp. EAN1pec]
MKTVAVIIHWGPPDPTIELATRLDGSVRIDQVTVVANDRSERPGGLAPGVSWLVPSRDLGFGGGFRHAAEAFPSASAYLLVDNDVWIDDTAIAACLDLLAGTNIGVVAPTLVGDTGVRSAAARRTRFLVAPKVLGHAPVDRPSEARWVAGAAMFIKAACHRRVPMDGRYFLGFEDVDFCHRARNAGWSVVISPALAWHGGRDTVPPARYGYYEIRNRLWFTRVRHWPVRTILVALWTAVITLPRTVVLDLFRRRGTAVSALVLHGLVDGLGSLPPSGDPRPDEPRVTRWTAEGWMTEGMSGASRVSGLPRSRTGEQGPRPRAGKARRLD